MIHLAQLSVTPTAMEAAATCGVLLGVTYIIWRWRSRSQQSFLTPNTAKDTVVLHQYGKALTVPSISPFVIKLATYLRAAKIPYVDAYSRRPGPKQKLPWIQYNNQAVPDSQLCIEFLNTQRQVNLNNHLTPDEIAKGHLIRRVSEESLYWVLLMWRLVFESSGDLYKKLGVPAFVVWYMRREAKSRLWSHGIGRYSQQEVIKIMEDDLSAISTILGERNFLFGDVVEDVSEFDCALFGQLCQLLWQTPGTPVAGIIAEKFPNLVHFCERMKSSFWPDWDQKLLHPTQVPTVGHTVDASKGHRN
ncbi:unnamed protein product [Candidula unifasciata]|uniref:Failed axon connections homolog n=1 Tax=Candidula unifasciata TaxID=100452 RepID=A0A8S3ZGS5_9EUPU|nr:unnamed protein product [Candidula unifasciata]